MKFYLAGRYERRDELAQYAEHLKKFGHEVTSRWLEGDPPWMEMAEIADRNLEDIRKCDFLIGFTEDQVSLSTRGGRHVEYGYALASGKMAVIVGPRENIFYELSEIMQFQTWEDALTWVVLTWPIGQHDRLDEVGTKTRDPASVRDMIKGAVEERSNGSGC